MKDYFSHDYNSRNDKKLVRLTMKHGMAGIGIFWCIIEMLYEEGGYLPTDEYERITFDLRTDYEVVKSVIEDFDLFKNDGSQFWSETAIERLKQRSEKSEKARQSIEARWNKKRNTNVLQSNDKRNTIKESKGKEIKVKENKVFTPPTFDEVKEYCLERGKPESLAIRFFDFFSAGNWHDSKGIKVKNWKQKFITWESYGNNSGKNQTNNSENSRRYHLPDEKPEYGPLA